MLITFDHGPVRCFKLARAIRGRPVYHTACYLVDGLMIDTGCAHTEAELTAALAGERIETIVNTHAHEDHIGANAALAQAHGARILAHRLALPGLENPRRQKLRPYQRVMWGRPRPSRGEAVPEVIETEHYRFRVIDTPGHCPGHIVLHEPDQGWLFAGDAFVGGLDKALRADYDIWGIIEGYRIMAGLEASRLFPGSGGVRDNPGPELKAKIDYLTDLGRQVLELHRQGLAERQIARRLLGPEQLIAWFTLGNFSARHMVKSYLRRPPAGGGESD